MIGGEGEQLTAWVWGSDVLAIIAHMSTYYGEDILARNYSKVDGLHLRIVDLEHGIL